MSVSTRARATARSSGAYACRSTLFLLAFQYGQFSPLSVKRFSIAAFPLESIIIGNGIARELSRYFGINIAIHLDGDYAAVYWNVRFQHHRPPPEALCAILPINPIPSTDFAFPSILGPLAQPQPY